MKIFRTIILMFIVFLTLSGFAYADGLKFTATLTAAQEVPDNPSSARGDIEVEFDKGFTKLDVGLKVRGTVGEIRAAHFHCGKPGENGPIVFGLFMPGPFPVSDRVDGTLTNADYTGAVCNPEIGGLPIGGIGRPVNNLVSLAFAMRDGLIYANVHTTFRPGGEIRGQMIEVIDEDKNDKDDRDRRK